MEWTGARYADKPSVEVDIWIDAPPERVWDLVSDIDLMPHLSAELQSVHWLDGATGPVVGARFRGRNSHAAFGEWETTSHVVEYEPPHVFAWAIDDPANPSAIWRFRLRPENGGTALSQWAQLGPAPSGLSRAIERMPDREQKIVFVRLREFESGMRANLAEIKQRAEA
ncbi:SRPBCC family protein [Nocardia sp. bgisy134]|uniref:SRPBCC family protein n=1 Tax=Nocardia sp. bgisy134 TaxID=3413789 RepID=UPI003D761F9E